MAPTQSHRELEVKVRVPEDFDLPDLTSLGATVEMRPAIQLEATYFDTEELSLIRWGVTLRRRTGGADEGWHAKLPLQDAQFAGAREELRMPLAASPSPLAVPPELADTVAPLARGLRLLPAATVTTSRQPYVLALDGVDTVEVVDDRVTVGTADGTATGTVIAHYREVEVELLIESEGARALLDSVVASLLAGGASLSSASKAASALGPRAAQPADIPELPLPQSGALAVDVLRSALAEHARHLLMADVAVRRDLPDAVHQMRVACRRLRSTLRTFAPLLDQEWSAALREELAWMASELGAIRDTEVLLERLDDMFDGLPEADAARAHEAIDPWLRQRLTGARSGALAALRSDRHDWLIDDLVEAVAAPRVVDAAYEPADVALAPLLRRAWKRCAARVRRMELSGPAAPWHEARIAAKQARYAAEALAPVLGTRVASLAALLKEATEILGDHQDADVAREVLRARAAAVTPDAAFSLGLAHERETMLMGVLRAEFTDLWPAVRKAAKQAGAR